MDGKTRHQSDKGSKGSCLSHWLAALQILDMSSSSDMRLLPPHGNSHQPLSVILDVAQPTLSRAGVARGNSQEKKLARGRNAPSEELPFWSNFLDQ
ncbi:hypothetical protein N7457_002699 [Penicillium paradoxum]|uniref:uncharacterized protein n=1 Tax=Penicillium paradoxum TaxID=176176 RepID=UPI00254672D3|nr:uncharacterized protein N7457_002699 [Penicillium paradoxum]KAJ5787709.1 hypothetical protein N7457_002699 [Penicillium paradoxum]